MFDFGSQTLSIALCLLIIWLSIVSFFLYKNVVHYNRLVKGEDKKNLKEILDKILRENEISKEEIKNLRAKTAEIENSSLYHLQKMGLFKFNPFKDIGSEQSFVLSLLDKKSSGVVITSLHSRETTRFYVKRVKEGRGVDYELSKEEIEAIKKASKV